MSRPTLLPCTVALAMSIACGSTSSSTAVGPSPVRCEVALTANPAQFKAAGGDGTLSVAAARECSWSATSQTAWVVLTQPAAGQGDGAVKYRVLPNPQAVVRRGAVVVGGQTTELTQEASPCSFAVSRSSIELDSRDQISDVTVQAADGCAWTAVSGSAWITIVEGDRGSGPGRVRFRVSANPGPAARSGSLTVAGIRVDVRQLSGNAVPPPPPPGECTYAVSPESAEAPAAGTDADFSVVTQIGCSWTAVSDESWLTVVTGAAGSGQGRVVYRAAANSSSQGRTGHIDVNRARFTLVQAGSGPGCNYSINPTSQSFPANGGSGDIDVDAGALCIWTAATTASWIDITSGAIGTGRGEVRYQVDANSGTSSRSGTIRVAGRDFKVQQAAGGEERTVQGLIGDLSGSCPDRTFEVDDQDIRTTSSTSYNQGGCSKLKNGERVQVRGIVSGDDDDDVLTATEVQF